MNSWLLSIVGIVFLCVLFDIVYPNGKTNTLCKSIFGIFSVFVMISPLVKIDFDNAIESTVVNEILIENINKAKDENERLKIIELLKENGIDGVNVEIVSILNYNVYEIKNIYVDTTNLVLTENITNINKYEVIANKIAEIVDIDLERIIVYG